MAVFVLVACSLWVANFDFTNDVVELALDGMHAALDRLLGAMKIEEPDVLQAR